MEELINTFKSPSNQDQIMEQKRLSFNECIKQNLIVTGSVALYLQMGLGLDTVLSLASDVDIYAKFGSYKSNNKLVRLDANDKGLPKGFLDRVTTMQLKEGSIRMINISDILWSMVHVLDSALLDSSNIPFYTLDWIESMKRKFTNSLNAVEYLIQQDQADKPTYLKHIEKLQEVLIVLSDKSNYTDSAWNELEFNGYQAWIKNCRCKIDLVLNI